MMKKKLNGYIKLFFVALAIAGVIWSLASINGKLNENNAVLKNEVKHIGEDITKIEQRLEKIEQRLWNERGKE